MKSYKKLLILRISAVFLSFVVLCFTVFLFLFKSGAWLRDEGNWVEREYYLGKIDYNFSINDTVLNTVDEIEYDAAIPIVGGVKINDTAVNEKYSEENFNEGVTAAHFKIENISDIKMNMTVTMTFNDFFDNSPGNNLFYLILPQDSFVNFEKHTVRIGDGKPVSYKDYVKTCMDGKYSTYEEMKASLSDYYTANPSLYIREKEFSAADGDSVFLEFDVLFWSEYDIREISSGSSDISASDWKTSNGNVENISASMHLAFEIKQPEKK